MQREIVRREKRMISRLKNPRSQQNRDALDALRNGESCESVAERFGIKLPMVRYLYKRYAYAPTRLPGGIELEVLQDLRHSNMMQTEIAEKYGLNINTITSIKNRYIGSELWDKIPDFEPMEKPVQQGFQESPSKANTTSDSVLIRARKKKFECSACGRGNAVRINIQNNERGLGITLCIKCLTLIRDEVIEQWQEEATEMEDETETVEGIGLNM